MRGGGGEKCQVRGNESRWALDLPLEGQMGFPSLIFCIHNRAKVLFDDYRRSGSCVKTEPKVHGR
jgi:hypothetical protein